MRPIAPLNEDTPIDVSTLNDLIDEINTRLAILDAPLIGQGRALQGTIVTDTTGLANNVVLGSGVYHEVAQPVATILTGFVGGSDAREEILKNAGVTALTLAHEHSSSRETNRFKTRTGADFAVAAGAAVRVVYSGRDQRWIVVGLLD